MAKKKYKQALDMTADLSKPVASSDPKGFGPGLEIDPPLRVEAEPKFPPDATLCMFCDAHAVVNDVHPPGVTRCLNCGKVQPKETPGDNVRAAEAGKAMLPLPMPVQFTARELVFVQQMLMARGMEAQAHGDQKAADMIKVAHEKVFVAARAWWDDAEASTKLWSLIEKLDAERTAADTSTWKPVPDTNKTGV